MTASTTSFISSSSCCIKRSNTKPTDAFPCESKPTSTQPSESHPKPSSSDDPCKSESSASSLSMSKSSLHYTRSTESATQPTSNMESIMSHEKSCYPPKGYKFPKTTRNGRRHTHDVLNTFPFLSCVPSNNMIVRSLCHHFSSKDKLNVGLTPPPTNR